MMYNGEYVSGIDSVGGLIIKSGEVSKAKLMTGNGFPLPFLRQAMFTGTFVGSFNKVYGGKTYQATAELKNIWYHVVGNCPYIVFKNDWKSWGFVTED